MRRVASLLSLLTLAACGGGSAAPQADGPPAMSVLSGNHQVVSAAPSVALPSQVVAQVIRLPNGQVSMTTRFVDALLPPTAYAQTAVNGIPGAVVCAVAPDPKHQLTPEVPCTNTDALGKAYFTYHADTAAGIARSQVRGTVNGVTQVSDSVEATVRPSAAASIGLSWAGAYSQFYTTVPGGDITIPIGGTVDLHKMLRLVQDKYHNMIAPSDLALVTDRSFLADTVSNFTPAYAVRSSANNVPPTAPDATGWIVTPTFARSGDAVTVSLFAGTAISATFVVRAQ